jgi:AcrR family transcriptional regulator
VPIRNLSYGYCQQGGGKDLKEEKRSLRQKQIETTAYEVLEAKGYGGTSMLGIAKKARASNETLYNWYGDKQGLFQALVTRNAEEVKSHLEAELKSDNDALSILRTLGPKLLTLLTGDRAVALNRAAAADSSGELGATLANAGRDAVFPLLEKVLVRAKQDGQLFFERSDEAVGLYLDLLVGDQQIRRVIGRLPTPTLAFCKTRSDRSLKHLGQLLGAPEPK